MGRFSFSTRIYFPGHFMAPVRRPAAERERLLEEALRDYRASPQNPGERFVAWLAEEGSGGRILKALREVREEDFQGRVLRRLRPEALSDALVRWLLSYESSRKGGVVPLLENPAFSEVEVEKIAEAAVRVLAEEGTRPLEQSASMDALLALAECFPAVWSPVRLHRLVKRATQASYGAGISEAWLARTLFRVPTLRSMDLKALYWEATYRWARFSGQVHAEDTISAALHPNADRGFLEQLVLNTGKSILARLASRPEVWERPLLRAALREERLHGAVRMLLFSAPREHFAEELMRAVRARGAEVLVVLDERAEAASWLSRADWETLLQHENSEVRIKAMPLAALHWKGARMPPEEAFLSSRTR